MRHKTFYIYTLLTLAAFIGSVISLKNSIGNATADEQLSGKVASELNNSSEPSLPIYKANKNISRDKLYDINKIINKDALSKKNAKLEKVELMTFEEGYKILVLGGDAKHNPQISPDRLVWIVQVYHPQGFETRAGLIKNARVVGLYDAETGRILSISTTRVR